MVAASTTHDALASSSTSVNTRGSEGRSVGGGPSVVALPSLSLGIV